MKLSNKKIRIDLDEMRLSNTSIWTNPQVEARLRKIGFVIPEYPEQGPVYYATNSGQDLEVVGYMSNFNGLMIYEGHEQIVHELNLIDHGFTVWNPPNKKNNGKTNS